MPFCSNCGAELADGMKFCPQCGSAVGAVSAPAQPETPAAPLIDFSVPVERSDYSVILVSQGAATKTALRELLEDMLGYTVTDARKLTNGMVMEVARYLTAEQAMYVAQAMTEYGAEVAISTPSGFVDMRPMLRTSVFNNAGYFTAAVTAAFATLTSQNRVSVFTPWMRGDVYRHLFAPIYRRPAPPPHIRRARPAPPPGRAPAPRSKATRPAPARPARTSPPRASRPTPPKPKSPGAFRPGGRGPGRGPGPGRR